MKHLVKYPNIIDLEEDLLHINRPYVALVGKELIYDSINLPYEELYFSIRTYAKGFNLICSLPSVEMSLNDGSWENCIPSYEPGDIISFRGTINEDLVNDPFTLRINGPFDVFGNVMSLYEGDDFQNITSTEGYNLQGLFNGAPIISAKYLILPATTLTDSCYAHMFERCQSLTDAPELPATTLAPHCYESMFQESSITIAPKLPAMILAESCYSNMFYETPLLKCPELPATTLAPYCYASMFAYTSITEAIKLPATTLATRCYVSMFYRCHHLQGAPKDMLPALTLTEGCYSNMFCDITGFRYPPDLPATTLADSCYARMFYYCDYLEYAPELPAETLVPYCYSQMFFHCNHINHIKCLATTLAQKSTDNWVWGVSNTGVFEKASTMLDWTIGYSGIPSGWTTDKLGLNSSIAPVDALQHTISAQGHNLFNDGWTLSNENDWITTDISSGTVGNFNITFTISNNTTSNSRQGTIYFVSNETGESFTEVISQQAPTIDIVTTHTFDKSNQTVSISGYSTYSSNWSIINDVSWITNNTVSYLPGTMNISLTLSEAPSSRTGTIYIACEGMQQNIPITISQNDSGYSVNIINNWVVDTTTGPNGETVYVSTNHADDSSGTMYINIQGYTTFDIYGKASSEEDYDELLIYNLDSESSVFKRFSKESSNPPFNKVTFSTDGGSHSIKIVYEKDSSNDESRDRAWVYVPSEYRQL